MLSRGHLSLADIAASHGLTLPQLALFLNRPKVQAHLAEINSGLASATRLVSLTHLPSAAGALGRVLANSAASSTPLITSTASSPSERRTESLRSAILRVRHTATLVRAASLLHRLSRTTGDAPQPPRPRDASLGACSPGPDGGAVSRRETEGALPALLDVIHHVRANGVVFGKALSPAPGMGDVVHRTTEGAMSPESHALCAQHGQVRGDSLSSPVPETRYPEPDSAPPLPTSEFRVPTFSSISSLDHSATFTNGPAP